MTQEKLYGPTKVGGDILAWCTKCRIDLAHVCIAMLGTKPAKVVCKTCKSQHNYKLGSGPARPKAGAKAKETKTTMRAADYWEKRVAELKKSEIVPYATTGIFKKNELVQHTLFGVGVVDEVRSLNKIVVTFRLGEKVLVHGMVPQQ